MHFLVHVEYTVSCIMVKCTSVKLVARDSLAIAILYDATR